MKIIRKFLRKYMSKVCLGTALYSIFIGFWVLYDGHPQVALFCSIVGFLQVVAYYFFKNL